MVDGKREILEKIKNAGIVGAGGGGFPAHIKLSSSVETVIANGAECEPLIDKDKHILIRHTEEFLRGFKTVLDITDAKKGYIALKKKYINIIEKLKHPELKNLIDRRIEIFELDDYYPAGDEFELVYLCTGKHVPERGIPIQVGTVVSNIETIYNIFEAVYRGNPVMEKFLTINGEVPSPCTMRAPIGASAGWVLGLCGLPDLRGLKVLDGGPMMGTLLQSLDEPVKKTTSSFLVLPEDHKLVDIRIQDLAQTIRKSASYCIQCTRCTDLCSRHTLGYSILPHKMMRQTDGYRLFSEYTNFDAHSCSQCGICELYACSYGLSPRRAIEFLKQMSSPDRTMNRIESGILTVRELRDYSKIPVSGLLEKLNISQYSALTPFIDSVEQQPYEVKILMKQHTGAPCTPLVSTSDRVKKGEIIGHITDGSTGACIHASISGTVTAATADFVKIKFN